MRLAGFGKLTAVFLIPCFLYLAYIAGSWGLADAYARPAINTLTKWKQGGIRLQQDDWRGLQEDMARALQLDPDNPELHQWMGVATEGPYRSYFTNQTEGDIARRSAAEHYRNSTSLQPTWPHAWIDLANVKFRLDEIDTEFFEAVHNAVKYGPWEPGVQESVVRMGIVLWGQLSGPEQKFFLETMGNSLQHGNRVHATATLELLHGTKRLPDVGARYPELVIAAVMRNLEGASSQVVKDMMVILDETDLWSQLTPQQNEILLQSINKSLEQAGEQYRQEVNEILERHQ